MLKHVIADSVLRSFKVIHIYVEREDWLFFKSFTHICIHSIILKGRDQPPSKRQIYALFVWTHHNREDWALSPSFIMYFKEVYLEWNTFILASILCRCWSYTTVQYSTYYNGKKMIVIQHISTKKCKHFTILVDCLISINLIACYKVVS